MVPYNLLLKRHPPNLYMSHPTHMILKLPHPLPNWSPTSPPTSPTSPRCLTTLTASLLEVVEIAGSSKAFCQGKSRMVPHSPLLKRYPPNLCMSHPAHMIPKLPH